jgi:molybdate transport system substrate-binding protein
MTVGSLRMISSMATREVLAALAGQFQQETGVGVTAEAAGGVDVAQRVSSGEIFDVVVLAGNAIDKLTAEGRLLAGSRVDIVRSGVAIAVPCGAVHPDVSNEAAVRDAVGRATSISYSTGPSGVHLEKLFERWGLLEALRSRVVVPPPGVPVGSLVADGRAALGFQQLSELINLPGVDVLGPLPPQIQSMTVFAGAVTSACAQPQLARSLLEFMARPATATLKQRHGMDAADAR